MKKTYKCSDLYTATFEDGALMTGTLDQLYAAPIMGRFIIPSRQKLRFWATSRSIRRTKR